MMPGGLGLTASQRLLLQRYSRRPVITMAELGRLGPPEPVEWSGEGTRVHCFSKVRGHPRRKGIERSGRHKRAATRRTACSFGGMGESAC